MIETLSTERNLELKHAYELFDIHRPPFEFPTREEGYQSSPAYPEVDETKLWEMEDRVFHPKENFPFPPEDTSEDHPLKRAWGNLAKAEEELFKGIEEIKRLKESIKTAPEEESTKIVERMNRVDHLQKKKVFFQRALTYLYLYKNCPDVKTKDPKIHDLLDEVEVIFMGHVSYAVVRSGAHRFGPFREDGTLVMDHCYKTSVYVINRYLEELEGEKKAAKRRKIYHQIKKGILISMPHDYLEDFKELSREFLEDKLAQHCTWETNIEGDLREPNYKNIPHRSNFFRRNSKAILRGLDALTKPPKEDPQQKTYLERQVENNWKGSAEDHVLVARSKIGDRIHNVRTIGAKKPEKQADYMIETGKIVDMTARIAEKPRRKGLHKDIQALIQNTKAVALSILSNENFTLPPEVRNQLETELERQKTILEQQKKAA